MYITLCGERNAWCVPLCCLSNSESVNNGGKKAGRA